MCFRQNHDIENEMITTLARLVAEFVEYRDPGGARVNTGLLRYVGKHTCLAMSLAVFDISKQTNKSKE